jgi:hypothetical protein
MQGMQSAGELNPYWSSTAPRKVFFPAFPGVNGFPKDHRADAKPVRHEYIHDPRRSMRGKIQPQFRSLISSRSTFLFIFPTVVSGKSFLISMNLGTS